MKQLLAASMLIAAAGCAGPRPKPAAPATPAPAPASKPAPISAEEACIRPDTQCLRSPIIVSLRRQDGSAFQQILAPPSPVIQGGYVFIFPGQTLYIEADAGTAGLTNLRLVPEVTHPEKTLTLVFQQMSDKSRAMTFSIQNPFDRILKYRAGIMPLEGNAQVYQTSTCPVIPKGGGFETWPQPLFQLVLGEFRFLAPDAKDAGVCAF